MAGTVLQGSCHWFVLRESAGLSFSTSDSPLGGPRPFLPLVFHPALPFFFGLAVLADASTAHAIVSHPNFYFAAQLALYATSGGFVSNSLLPVPTIVKLTLAATPVDRSLVMRALGGAITSPCSNDSGSRRPTPTISGLFPQLLVFFFLVCD